MSDVTRDAVDDGFHEIHLSGKQLFFVFMATVAVSVAIFLIGVFVGRNVRSQQLAEHLTDPTIALAASTAPPPAAAPAASASDSGPEAAEPPTPPAESAELCYKKRVEGESATSESLKSGAAAAAAAPAPAPAAESRRRSEARSTPAPVQQQAAAPATVGAPQPGTWVIQIHVLRDRAAANTIVRRLAGKGYPAFVVAAGPPTGTYKVQVGRYKDRDEALKVIERLKKEEQFKPWITR